MTTPSEELMEEGASTWPEMQPVCILFDPYKPSNKNGGSRGEVLSFHRALRRKTHVIVLTKANSNVPDVLEKVAALVETGFKDSEQFTVEICHDAEQALASSYGSNRQKLEMAPTVSSRPGIPPLSKLLYDKEDDDDED